MLYEFFTFIFALVALLIIFFVSIQKSQGGFFSGQGNNDSSIVFGGSGGMEIFQKITWFLGFLLIFGTLFLSIYKTKISTKSFYVKKNKETKNIEKNFKEDKEEKKLEEFKKEDKILKNEVLEKK